MSPDTSQLTISFNRLPLVAPDREIWGYCLAVANRVAPTRDRDTLIERSYEDLDMHGLTYGRPTFVWPTSAMLAGTAPLPEHDGPLGLLIETPRVPDPDLESRLDGLRAEGLMTVLFDYHASDVQNALLPHVSHVMIDYSNVDIIPEYVAGSARAAGVEVIAENVARREYSNTQMPWPDGADLVMGSIFGDRSKTGRDLTPGEVQCLEVVRLLSEEDVDPAAVATVLGSDPALTVRVLRLVNASSEGLPRRVDSLQQAIVLLGPAKVSGLVMASLISSTVKNVDALWHLVARAEACRILIGTDAAYTAGLLSALADNAGIPPRALVEQTRVSPAVASAITSGEGELGRALYAIVAHEHDDQAAVAATGLVPETVALAYLRAVPWALNTALTATGGR